MELGEWWGMGAMVLGRGQIAPEKRKGSVAAAPTESWLLSPVGSSGIHVSAAGAQAAAGFRIGLPRSIFLSKQMPSLLRASEKPQKNNNP